MLEPLAALRAVGQLPDVEIDIAGAALQLARIDTGEVDRAAAEAHLSTLAREAIDLAREVPAGDLAARAGALAGLLTGRHNYRGDVETYDDPANANLIQVIARRRGLPVALGILWLHCARAVGWGAHGLNFPGHFLLALEAEPVGKDKAPVARQMVLDVFAGGMPLDARDLQALLKRVAGSDVELTPGVLQPMSARRVLLRLQDNIRFRRLQAEDDQGALSCTESMLAIAPDDAPMWRDAAMLHARLDQVSSAVACCSRYLELVPHGDAAEQVRTMMAGLRQRLH